MSDADTNRMRLMYPKEGDRFELDHGTIRVGEVTPSEVSYVSWPSSGGRMQRRLSVDQWRSAVRRYLTRNESP